MFDGDAIQSVHSKDDCKSAAWSFFPKE